MYIWMAGRPGEDLVSEVVKSSRPRGAEDVGGWEDVMKVLFDERAIALRIEGLAREITTALPVEAREDLLLVGPLKGCAVFMVDLARALWRTGVRLRMDFIGLSSYGSGTESSGEIEMFCDLRLDVAGQHVLLVDDIIDTGRTLAFARRHIEARGPASLRLATLLDKPSRRVVPASVAHVGFEIEDVFVVGYGTDLAERFREVPFIGIYEPGAR